MTQDAEAMVLETEIDAPPERVWRAFSEPELAAAWLAPGEISTEPGDRFTLDNDGRTIDCEVLEAEPARRLRLGWRESNGGLASEVSFDLTPTPAGGTHLRIVHAPLVVSLARARLRAGAGRRPTLLHAATRFRMAA
jgi:uncharacterized protein YndB with AHSA1/START domain